MKDSYSLLRIAGLLFVFSSNSIGGEPVLEISGDGKNLNGAVKFFSDDGKPIGASFAIKDEKFEWVDIPEGATKAQIEIREVPSKKIDLSKSSNTLVRVGLPKIQYDKSGQPKALLNTSSSQRTTVKQGATGTVFLGQLSKPAPDDNWEGSSWKSLYLVDKFRSTLDRDSSGYEAAAKPGHAVRLDFPLYLRQSEEGTLVRSRTDPVVRAGQHILLEKVMKPDEKGNVYAEVRMVVPKERSDK